MMDLPTPGRLETKGKAVVVETRRRRRWLRGFMMDI